jgi:hypothetical protein
MMRKFAGADFSIEVAEDPKVTNPYAMVFQKPLGIGGEVVLRKVYIYDKGFFRGSKRVRDGREKAEKFVA